MNLKLKFLILSDVLILSSFGLIAPIFAIFISNNLEGGNLLTAATATTIFLVVKSVIQLPLSRSFIDKEKHKTRSLLFGTLLIVMVPFIYLAAKNVYVIFIAQAIYGIGTAFAYPSWFSLFTSNLDKRHKGFEYAIWSTGVGIGTALASILGAGIASSKGFNVVFIFVGIIALIGFFILIALDRIESKNPKRRK